MTDHKIGSKTTIVVPTIRENCMRDFLQAWEQEFLAEDAHVIIMEDNPEATFALDTPIRHTHLSWADIKADLGDREWIIPRRTDCVRSYGYYRAWAERPDMILTLDDDCYPTDAHGLGFIARHRARLEEGGHDECWQATGDGVITRGVPYYNTARKRRCVLNHGLWTNVPDYDAPTQLCHGRNGGEFKHVNQTIPVGRYYPMCGMNVALLPEVVPAFYFLLMGRDYTYDRFGDIWSGVFVKKIADHLGVSINSGDPAIEHKRASNVWANLRKEAAGLEINEDLWAAVDAVTLTERTFGGCYRQLARGLPLEGGAAEYMRSLSEAMEIWADLFQEEAAPAPTRDDAVMAEV